MLTSLLLLTTMGQAGAACCTQMSSRTDAIINPVEGNDERFFTRPGGAPNVIFALDTSREMMAWPDFWPATNGCDHGFEDDYQGTPGLSTSLEAAWYEPILNKVGANTTAPPYPNSDYVNEWFNNVTVYRIRGADYINLLDGGMIQTDGGLLINDVSAWGSNFNGGSPAGATTWTGASASAAITNACGADTACVACLETKGYYVRGSNAIDPGDGGVEHPGGVVTAERIATGNFLNYKGPKHQSVTSVLSSFIRDVQTVRFAVITSSNFDNGNKWNSTSILGSGSDMALPTPFWPNCDKAYPGNDANFPSQRNSILGSTFAANNPWNDRPKYAALLYAAGTYFRSLPQDPYTTNTPAPKWPSAPYGSWPTNNNFKESKSDKKGSVCDACGFSAVILMAGSKMPTALTPLGIDNIPNYARTVAGGQAPGCDSATNPLCNNAADELASWLYRNDFRRDYGGVQRITVFVVSFSKDQQTNEVLQNVARQGGGQFYAANNTVELRTRLYDLLSDLTNRSQTFATSAVTSVQTGQIQVTQLVPRMYPQRGLPWLGELYRFAQRNEFVDNIDYNNDGDKDDVFNVDQDGDVVIETDEGYFIKAVSFEDLTPRGLADGGSGDQATPFWEAAASLRDAGWQGRSVWTVIDSTNDNAFTSADNMVKFEPANWEALMPLLGLVPENCPSITVSGGVVTAVASRGRIFEKMTLTVATAVTSLNPLPTFTSATYPPGMELCARVVIAYTLGQDLADEDGDGSRTETRESILADIFHSSPVVVEPPPERFICDLGLSNQCARTMYAEVLPVKTTDQEAGSYADPQCSGVTHTKPYDIYRARNRARSKYVVVGSNGGMLHFFNNGDIASQSCPASSIAWTGQWSVGTGREEFAFMPPDLLAKLQEAMINGHDYFVDGDIMVRDIWNDDDGDGKKSADEFHTMVIGAEGRGGTHYFGVEMRFDTSGKLMLPDASYKPFRWLFPQPCSYEAPRFGKTLFTLNPKPPPIGPVLLESTAPGSHERAIAGAETIKSEERWVVMLAGGWSPALDRGRGVYMVDAYRGKHASRNDNLIWKAEFDPNATGDHDGPKKWLISSIVTPVAMVDHGAELGPDPDGFFDTALFGDLMGQFWVARMYRPGRLATSGVNEGLVENWPVARAFEMDRFNFTSPNKRIQNVGQFHYLPSVAVDPLTRSLYAYVGTGNRLALLEPYKGFCRFDNPMACSTYGCTVTTDYSFRRFADNYSPLRNQWTDQRKNITATNQLQYAVNGAGACDPGRAEYSTYEVKSCPGSNPDFNDISKQRIDCGLFGTNVYHCKRTSSATALRHRDLTRFDFNSQVVSRAEGAQRERFYGIRVFGGPSSDGGINYFREPSISPTADEAANAFDTGRLTDTTGLITNVSNVQCAQRGACDGGAGPFGWYVEYTGNSGGANPFSEKTATGAGIIAGCVLWSTLVPAIQAAGTKTLEQICSVDVASSRFYASDFQSGTPDCAAGFVAGDGGLVRFLSRSVLTPPPEPATIIQVSSTGQVRYSVQLPAPGEGQQFQVDVQGGGDVLQSTYELPVSRSSHECRHVSGGNCQPVP